MTTTVTWDQLMKATEGEEKYLGVQGAQAGCMTVGLNALNESAGGHILLNPGVKVDVIKLGLDTQAGEKAATIIGDIGRKNLAGPGLSTSTENDAMILFRGDKGSFMVS